MEAVGEDREEQSIAQCWYRYGVVAAWRS